MVRGVYLRNSSNVIVPAKDDIRRIYELGCYGSSSSTASLKPLFMRRKRRRFRDLDADSNWAEPWKLTLMEAYFLIRKGELDVELVDGDTRIKMESAMAWEEFSSSEAVSSKKHFAVLYAVYQRLRDQGWVVKMGQTYGGNFVVYQGDPDFFHSLFCVLVHDADNPVPLDWIDVTREMRVANQTAKEVMLAEVKLEQPPDVEKCEATVDFAVMLRWVLKHDEAGKERQPHAKLKRKLCGPARKKPAKPRKEAKK